MEAPAHTSFDFCGISHVKVKLIVLQKISVPVPSMMRNFACDTSLEQCEQTKEKEKSQKIRSSCQNCAQGALQYELFSPNQLKRASLKNYCIACIKQHLDMKSPLPDVTGISEHYQPIQCTILYYRTSGRSGKFCSSRWKRPYGNLQNLRLNFQKYSFIHT